MNVQIIDHLNLTKTKADGTHKVRNAPNGSREDKNNFGILHASGIDQTDLRLLMALAAHYNLEIRQGDVVDAYGSNNTWDDPANVRTRPLATIMEPWETGLEEAVIMIYVGVPAGVRDAPSMFEIVLSRSLLKAGMKRLFNNKNMWIMRKLEAILLISAYVDDFLDLLSRCLAACEMYDKVMKQLEMDGIQIKEKRLDNCPDGITFLAHQLQTVHNEYGYSLSQPQQLSAIRKALEDMGVKRRKVYTPLPANWSTLEAVNERHLNTPIITKQFLSLLGKTAFTLSTGMVTPLTFILATLSRALACLIQAAEFQLTLLGEAGVLHFYRSTTPTSISTPMRVICFTDAGETQEVDGGGSRCLHYQSWTLRLTRRSYSPCHQVH